MEKRYFVLKKGYLNIDEDYFYFSIDGNWKICSKLKETKVPRFTLHYVLKHLLNASILVISITILMYFVDGKLNSTFGIIYLFITIFNFFNYHFKVSQFKIPLSKIEGIQIASNELIVKFMNIKDKQIEHVVNLDDEAEIIDIKKYLNTHFNHKYSFA